MKRLRTSTSRSFSGSSSVRTRVKLVAAGTPSGRDANRTSRLVSFDMLEELFLCRCVDRSDANQFLIHELLDSHAGELAPVAGVFDAAERQVRRRPGRVVDEYNARVDAARHAFAARNIFVNRTAQIWNP